MCKMFFLIAALIFSVGNYRAPIFFYNSKNLNCIGALSFFLLRLEEEYWRSPFLQFKEFELYWGAVFFITTRRGVLEKSFF